MNKELFTRMLERAIDIQQIPAPTFHEGQRAEYIFNEFQNEGLVDVVYDEIGNVIGRYPGESSASSVVVSAHLDTVFPAGTDLKIKRTLDKISGPGIGDNAIGTAALFGLVWLLKETGVRLPGDVWLAANVGEEGLGDLRGMRGIVKRFGSTPKAYIVLEGMGLGRIFHRGLGVRRYQITCKTPGGHSWADYGTPSAVHEIARMVDGLVQIELPPSHRTTINVGKISGGTSINSIAAKATIEVDLRSENGKALKKLSDKVLRIARGYNRKSVEILIEKIGDRPFGALDESDPLIEITQKVIRELGISPETSIGSTDANYPLSKGFPAVCIGITHGGNPHRMDEYIDTQPAKKGMIQLLEIVMGVLQQ